MKSGARACKLLAVYRVPINCTQVQTKETPFQKLCKAPVQILACRYTYFVCFALIPLLVCRSDIFDDILSELRLMVLYLTFLAVFSFRFVQEEFCQGLGRFARWLEASPKASLTIDK